MQKPAIPSSSLLPCFAVISCPVIHDGVTLLKVSMGEHEQETGSVKTIPML